MKKTSPFVKNIILLTAAILSMYAAFGVSLYFSSKETDFDLSSADADTEFLGILETGGVSGGTHNERYIYTDNGRYCLEIKDRNRDPEVYELSKAEYILCTDADTGFLPTAPQSRASDSFCYEITVRRNGEEIIVPRKSYADPYFGLWRFVRDYRKDPPGGQISYDRYIDCESYIYSRGTRFSMLNYFCAADPDNKIYCSVNTVKTEYDYKEVMELYEEARKEASLLRKEPKKPELQEERERLIKGCQIRDYYGEKAYYTELSSQHYSAMVLTCPAYNDYVTFLYEKPDDITMERYNDDIRCILSGISPYRNDMYTFAAGSAVFLMLFVICAASLCKEKKETEKADETDKD